jgi:protein-disulfide isomerase
MRLPLLRRLAAAAGLAATLVGGAALAQAAPPLSEAQRKAFEQVIREYILKNPEILQEALVELEKRQQEAQRKAQAAALKESRDALLNPARAVTVGNPTGDVTIVEFFDYNCGYCKRALTDLQALLKSDPKLKVVLKDFPVLGAESVEASRVGLALKQQLKDDRMFEFHVKLMETKGRVNGERALAVAKELGVDMVRLQKDIASPEVQATLEEAVGLGDKLGVSGTPAFVIGDEVVSGAVGLAPMRQAIASVRQCGKVEC